ncbi:MFS transporter [Nocardioides sp. B-3]|uniref:MFS transporter n=1 Tax=Nocardioides sp. B-3 TaxID=2895565 RepID=UPI00215308C4|nr:MFS transporter [Nocardioides sp. B-3]UUZ61031.1 MFS transporter [Nocardioides sp. B-3]
MTTQSDGPMSVPTATLDGMGDPIIDPVRDTVGDQPVGRRAPGALTPFRTPAYRWLALALAASAFASGVWIVALVWEVIRLGGGPGQLSTVMTASAVGVLIPALLAGVVADRVPQKLILLTVALVELVAMAMIAFLSSADLNSVWIPACATFVSGMGMAFYYPAYSAWLPALIPESDLQAVNGFEGMVRPTIGQAIGPAVAGAVVGAHSPGAAFIVAAVSGAVALVVLARVPQTPIRRTLDEAHARHPVRSAFADMREGFGYMMRTPWLLATLLFASLMIPVMMGPLEVLIPFLIKDKLGGGPDDHSYVPAAFGIGGALGSLVMASVRMPRRYLTLMNLGWGLGCLPFLVIAVADSVWMVIGAAAVMGALFSAPMVIWGTLLQRRVPPELLGRVASLDFFVSISLMPISMALAGPVADAIGLRNTFYIAGIVPVVVVVVATVWAKLPADELAHPLRDDEEE